MKHGVAEADIVERWVPGSFELAAGAQFLLEAGGLHGVICLGSVVRGETPHFEFVCQGTTQGIMAVGLKFSVTGDLRRAHRRHHGAGPRPERWQARQQGR
jgi:6,7-dimethyl-8-ribityllumazine synthase